VLRGSAHRYNCELRGPVRLRVDRGRAALVYLVRQARGACCRYAAGVLSAPLRKCCGYAVARSSSQEGELRGLNLYRLGGAERLPPCSQHGK
jgi:hypothetical protein